VLTLHGAQFSDASLIVASLARHIGAVFKL